MANDPYKDKAIDVAKAINIANIASIMIDGEPIIYRRPYRRTSGWTTIPALIFLLIALLSMYLYAKHQDEERAARIKAAIADVDCGTFDGSTEYPRAEDRELRYAVEMHCADEMAKRRKQAERDAARKTWKRK